MHQNPHQPRVLRLRRRCEHERRHPPHVRRVHVAMRIDQRLHNISPAVRRRRQHRRHPDQLNFPELHRPRVGHRCVRIRALRQQRPDRLQSQLKTARRAAASSRSGSRYGCPPRQRAAAARSRNRPPMPPVPAPSRRLCPWPSHPRPFERQLDHCRASVARRRDHQRRPPRSRLRIHIRAARHQQPRLRLIRSRVEQRRRAERIPRVHLCAAVQQPPHHIRAAKRPA